jgi:hypothetical protein
MRAIAVTIFACLLLSDCTAEEQAKLDDSKCQSYGTKPGELPYLQCRAQLDAARNPTPPPAPVIMPPAAPGQH